MSLRPSVGTIRSGWTLLELLVVLGILAAVAAVSWPAVGRGLARARLREASRQLGAELARARLAAIETGRAQRVRCELGGGRLDRGPVPPAEPARPVTERASAPATPTPEDVVDAAGEARDAHVECNLPEGIRFLAAGPQRSPLDDRTPAADLPPDTELDRSPAAEPRWSEPIVFDAAGRASGGIVELASAEGQTTAVHVDPLTGAISVEVARSPEEPP
jgi:prepilin-type N-terminal cleavage/methylation domain-containing protein